MTQTSMLEVELERLIERRLTGSTLEDRRALAAGDHAAEPPATYGNYNGFLPGESDEMDRDKAINTTRLWSFLNKTQKDVLDQWRGRGDLKAAIEKEIDRKLNTKGILDTLRQKLEVDNIELTLYYPKPSPSDSQQSHRDFEANEWSVTRQQKYSKYHPGNEIDMVIFINGLPLFTIELKNPATHQTARYDGQKQYREDRDPRDILLKFARCLAHFTLDKDEVFFTTRLEGTNTYFMPFNQGLPNGQGAGNPINPNGHKTAYFWEKILTPDTLADIIQNFALVDYGEAKKHKKVPHLLKNAQRLIFPRFHQLDVVNSLSDDVTTKGVGGKYLIQHSAGSGKSNSITWLAFDLIKACPKTMDANRAEALDKQLFQSVIIVTDRRVLDSQIFYNVWAFAKSDKIIAHADSSEQLRKAIEAGKRIIITTIQKFPYICGTIADMSSRNFAVIIDEAHSSQSGIAADKLNATTYRDPDEDTEDTDSIIEKLIAERKMSPNTSYFAFTATPKPNTLERFGIPNANGGYDPFHLYSMKQAIEEGFILDVLSNYTTYTSYSELAKSIQDNPEYNETKAQKRLRRKVEREPKTIREKSEVIINHFDAKIFRARRLKGQAKAMVVTRDIECAIRYYNAINEIIAEQRLPYKPIIAFSGEKTVDGITYTESGINGFPDSQTPEKLDGNDYQILVVANKYLTGFDQEKLCAMYIDKPLDGVLAVQALSRLNRISPKLGKCTEDLAVIDFYNKIEEMKNAFNDFFTCTSLSEPTNINVLHDLRAAILDAGVFTEDDEVAQFNDLYQHGAEAHELSPILDRCVERFENEIEWDENGKPDFKIKCKQFVKVYSRVAAIMPFENVKWEKLYWFLRQLIPLLKVTVPNDDLSGLMESVDMNTYALRRTATNQKIELDATTTVLDPNSPNMAGAGSDDPTKSQLDIIIANFNERWFSGWDAPADERRVKMYRVAREIINTPQYQNQIVGNPDRDEADAAFNRIVDTVMRRMRRSDDSLYREYNQNEGFQGNFRNLLRQIIDDQDYREVVDNSSPEA